jgi:hypothetical protein
MDSQPEEKIRADLRYAAVLRTKRELEDAGRERYANESKERLIRIATKKIKTTMIGALASVENRLGFLWEPNENDDENTSQSKLQMHSVFEALREEILDNGNNQLRNLQSELDQYEVKWLRYQMTLPVRKPKVQEQ